MKKTLHKVDDVTLALEIDPDFRGILRGFAFDVSEGCVLKGEVVLTVRQHTKIKRLETVFTGLCHVYFKTNNGMGFPTSDGTETRGIYLKRVTHFDEYTIERDENSIITSTLFNPGVYKFPFSIVIPAALPHSFKSKHGSIDYRLSATAGRSAFISDMHISQPIVLRRSLMNDINPIAPPTQTVVGTKNAHIVFYSATAPSMVYCEGGLLKVDLRVALRDPARFSVRMITCGLKEKVSYRTTGNSSITNQPMRYDETSYPLGYGTLFPSEHAAENHSSRLRNYNAIIRLYPKVHTDNKAKLIAVRHMLVVRILVVDNWVRNATRRKSDTHAEIAAATRRMKDESRLTRTDNGVNGSRRSSLPTHLQHPLTILQQLSSRLRHQQKSDNTNGSNNNNNNELPSALQSPTHVTHNSNASNRNFPVAGATSSTNASAEATFFRLNPYSNNSNRATATIAITTPTEGFADRGFAHRSAQKMNQLLYDASRVNRHPHAPLIPEHQPVPDRSRRLFLSSSFGDEEGTPDANEDMAWHHHSKPFRYYKNLFSEREGLYECELTIPIIVTSREEYREGDVPALPDYQTIADGPPTYESAMQYLPPVPVYPAEQ